MKLNKTNSYVLANLMGGCSTAVEVSRLMPGVNIRSIQRALVRLAVNGLAARKGVNSPVYHLKYPALLQQEIEAKLIEDDRRPGSTLHHGFIAWLDSLDSSELDRLFGDESTDGVTKRETDCMTARELEYLTIEFSWKSSALEGNTYTLLDTQLLLLEGIKAGNRTEFETQMILNHKNAIAFIVANPELFGNNLRFATVEELHKLIGYNLGIESGVRKKLVRISASNYEPLAGPQQIRENAEVLLDVINRAKQPFAKALLALALIPYLQAFEDGNKRTGRMLANALLIHGAGIGFSLRKTDARALAIAYLAFYEFNSVRALSKILSTELS